MTNASALSALGDPTRRALFELLAEQPSSVGELARAFPVSRPAVSQHLRVLKEAGLVVDEKRGARNIYRVDPATVAELRDYLDRFWSTALAGFQHKIEKDSS